LIWESGINALLSQDLRNKCRDIKSWLDKSLPFCEFAIDKLY
jgi:hypothetical protein